MAGLVIQETIASLIELAEQGAIDPWDVRAVEVLDRYLLQLQRAIEPVATQMGKAAYDVHLSRSAQAFVSAALLVLIKANRLTLAEFPPLDASDDDWESAEELESVARGRLPLHLEQCLKRRGVAPKAGQRRVSLGDMIEQLQQVASLLATQPPRPHKARRPSRRQKMRAVQQLAHQENLGEVSEALAAFLQPFGDRWLGFDELVTLVPRTGPDAIPLTIAHETPAQGELLPPEPTKSDRAGAFWALLLLASQSKVELEQTVFYQDLRVRSLPEPSPLIPDP
ncbi:MAG: segregation/condensation protein A [Oscillatoriales cyanobacterium]|nr:MAG: segregation/condensation protein A [Oscillatoriales cyanobacterium]